MNLPQPFFVAHIHTHTFTKKKIAILKRDKLIVHRFFAIQQKRGGKYMWDHFYKFVEDDLKFHQFLSLLYKLI